MYYSHQQSKLKTAHHSIVEPLLNVLRSLHLEVQDEGKQRTLLSSHCGNFCFNLL